MFRAAFTAGETTREVRIPFKEFRSSSEAERQDLARLRAVVIRLEGQPGGQETLELGNIRFYR